MEHWWCLDCRTRVELDQHGRCQYCGSDGVDTMERTGMYLTASSVMTPVNQYAERLTVHVETTLRWEPQTEIAIADEPVLSY